MNDVQVMMLRVGVIGHGGLLRAFSLMGVEIFQGISLDP